MDKKTIAILGLLVLIFILVYQRCNPDKFPIVDQIKYDALQEQYDSLVCINIGLEIKLKGTEEESARYRAQNDSLQKLKNPIKLSYQQKYEKIKTIGAYSMADEFGRVFTDNNIK